MNEIKVVINSSFGGFGVTEAVFDELGLEWDGHGFLDNDSFEISSMDVDAYRCHLPLITAIERVGIKESSGDCAQLKIITVPSDVDWHISEYDGLETIKENHREWY